MRALDVVPDKYYLARLGANWEIVTVTCGDTHGWQRGYVIIGGMNGYNHAEVKVLGGRSYNVRVERWDDEFVFVGENKKTSLKEVTADWIRTQVDITTGQIKDLESQLENRYTHNARLWALLDQVTNDQSR